MSLVDPALEYFVAAYETGSVNAAARRLFIATSAVSRQLTRLERELGVMLFDRVPQGLKPTAAGHAFAAYARRAIGEAAAVTGELRDRETMAAVTVAGTEGIIHELLPAVAARASTSHPALRMRLRRATPAGVSEMVRDGAADLGVAFNLSLAAGVQVMHSVPAPVHAVVRRGHPIAGLREATFHEITRYPLVLSRSGATSRILFDAFAAGQGVAVDPVLETDDIAAVVRFVRGTDAVSLLSTVSLTAGERADVVAVPMREQEFRARRLQLQCRVGQSLHPAARVIADLLEEELDASEAGLAGGSAPDGF